MTFTTPNSPTPNYEKANYTPSSPNPPRCSLDFKIFIEGDDNEITIIDDTQLRLQNFKGHESLSQPFEFELELRANDYFSGPQPELDRIVRGIVDTLEDIGVISDTTAQTIENQYRQPYGEILNPNNKNTHQLDFDKLLGANATILLGSPETDNDVDNSKYPGARPVIFFNGIITNFSLAERGVYHATLKPALFKLSLQNSYRLFPSCTILDVVKQVLTENNIAFNKTELDKQTDKVIMGLATYRKQDWLQAGESDFDFITRLMNKVSLFYYFTHTENSHTMVITDQPHYKTIYKRDVNKAGYNKETDTIKPLYLSYTQQASLDRDDYITQFKYQQNLTTTGLTTVLAQKESTWESQNTAQTSPVFLDRENQKEKLNMEQIHIVQYGASKDEIGKITNTTMNKIAAAKYDFSGSSSCAELKAGHKFQVKEAFQSTPETQQQPIRPLLNNREFVATSVQHQASALGDYKNQFSAVAAEGLATPFNPQGAHQGTILARVTSVPTSKQSATSTTGSVGIQALDHTGSSAKQLEKNVFAYDSKDFNYELESNKTNPFSCRGVYVRFIDQPEAAPAQWVKISEQMTTIPEVGVYVVVSRSQDSNEIPEIQQTLEAKGSKNIMPEGYSTHTSVGNNYNTSYGNSTGISFGADITTPLSTATNIVNTQRTTNNYNDVRYSESSSYSYNVTKHSHNISRTGTGASLKFDPSDMMNYVSYGHNATYGDTYNESYSDGNSTQKSTTDGNTNNTSKQTGSVTSSNTIIGNTSNTSSTTGNTNNTSTQTGSVTSTNTVIGNTDNTSTQTGSVTSTNTVTGNTTNTSTNNGNTTSTSTNNGSVTSTNTVTGNTTNTSTNNGNTTSTSTNNGSTTSNNTVTGKSTSTSNNFGGTHSTSTVTGGSFSKSTVDTSNNINIVGASTSESATGASNNVSATGASNNASTTGVSTGASVTGVNGAINKTLTDNSITSTTNSNTIQMLNSGVYCKIDNTANVEQKLTQTTIFSAIRVIL
jgi:type VI secretion system secreted protein VgrG